MAAYLRVGSVPVARVVGDVPVSRRPEDSVRAVLRCGDGVEGVRPVVYGVAGGDGDVTRRHVSLPHSHGPALGVGGERGRSANKVSQ